MQEDMQMIVYKRGKEIIGKSISLALVVISSCVVGYKVSEKEIKLEKEKASVEITLRDYQMKKDLQQMTNQYKEFQIELEKIITEAETTRKNIALTTVTYVSNEKIANQSSYTNSENKEAPTEYKAVYDVKATAYCLCKKCCGKSTDDPNYGETSSGLRIIPGTGMKVIAVDPNLIPLGSKVYVEGLNGAKDYGYAIAADQGSAIKNNKIDLYMETHQQALNWGKKSVRVYVVE